MTFTASKAMIAVVALGVTLGGCATRESVENAQASANAADRRAGNAAGRADEAYGIGSEAITLGRDAKSAALVAEQKADQANADLASAKERITTLETRLGPPKKARRVSRSNTNS